MRKIAIKTLAAAALVAAGCGDGAGGGTPSASLSQTVSVPAVPSLSDIAAVAADFNRDGFTDLAVLSVPSSGGSGQTSCISIYYGPFTNGSLPAPAEQYLTAETASGLAARDLDGDGVLDVAVSQRCNGSVGSPVLGRVHVVFRRAGGGRAWEADILVGLDATCVRTGDVDGDGNADVIASGGGYTFIARGLGGGAFEDQVRIPRVSHPLAADFNGDGWDDIAAISDADPRRVEIYRWDRTNGPVLAATLSFPMPVGDLAAADMNRDGNLALVAGLDDGSGSGAVRVVPGNGDFTFGTASSAGSAAVTLVAAGDLNGDGAPDIGCWNPAPDGTLASVLANGAGGYGAGNSYALGGTARALVAADLDGDGRADLVLCSGSTVIYFSSNWLRT